MFSHRRKLDKNLQHYLTNKTFNSYRILIKCKSLRKGIEKKISSYKGTLHYSLEYSNIVCATLDNDSIERLIEYPEIEYISLDTYLFLCGMSVKTANRFYLTSKNSLSGKGIGIGLIDSGLYPHTDLLHPSNKILAFIDLINGLNFPYDDNGHGTAIAGIISGSGITSNNIYKGIAEQSDIVCYKAFDKLGKGFASTILFALESLIKDSSCYNIKILALPFELLSHNVFVTSAFDKTFKQAIAHGITPIVPSGSNLNNEPSIMGIATLDSCITVGGIDTTSKATPYLYSSAGPCIKKNKPNLSAACCNITCLNSNTSYISEKDGRKLYPPKLDASYKVFSGTSFAVAYVSGICALLYENNPGLSFKDICSVLSLSCDLGEFVKNKQGEGILNIGKLFN